jgi:hypothetical protein
LIAALHLTAGVIAGGIFPVQFLLLLIAGTLLECSAAAIVHGFAFGATQALLLLLVLQVGYLLGSYLRNLVEVSLNNVSGRGDLRGRSDEPSGYRFYRSMARTVSITSGLICMMTRSRNRRPSAGAD